MGDRSPESSTCLPSIHLSLWVTKCAKCLAILFHCYVVGSLTRLTRRFSSFIISTLPRTIGFSPLLCICKPSVGRDVHPELNGSEFVSTGHFSGGVLLYPPPNSANPYGYHVVRWILQYTGVFGGALSQPCIT